MGIGRWKKEEWIIEGQLEGSVINGWGRMINEEMFHTGWFKNGIPHGFGTGNMFVEDKGEGSEYGWYEKKATSKDGNYFQEDEKVSYDKKSQTTKSFDIQDK